MKLSKKLIITLVLLSFTGFIFAEGVEHSTSTGVEFAYYFDNNAGYGQVGGFLPISYSPVAPDADFTPAADDYSATEARNLGSGWGALELQLYLKHRIMVPFLQGSGALTEGNNVTFNFDLYAAPVAAYAKASATLTPIAFLNFNVGGTVGTGWNAVLFNGVGDNVNGKIDTTSFPGVVLEAYGSGTFQFDLAALIPGDWTHVVTVASVKATYKYFSGAADGEPWQWLADSGENLNGWKLGQTYLLGYQMPIVCDTVGILFETDQMLGKNAAKSTMESGGWGSDFVKMSFGPLANFTFDEHHSLTTLVQFETGRDYTDDTIFNRYYQNREYEGTFVKLNRLALVYNYNF